MRILVAEDDMGSRIYMQHFMKGYGACDLTSDGIETVDAFLLAWEEGEPYDLICLDIMMPKLDGLKALKIIRDLEKKRQVSESQLAKVIMTTALDEKQTAGKAFELGCQAFIPKPIDQKYLKKVLAEMGFAEVPT